MSNGSAAAFAVFLWIVSAGGLPGFASVADPEAQGIGMLPFEEKFHDFHKGSWRASGREGEWRSGPLSVSGCESVVVSFDVNSKGNGSARPNATEYLKVGFELDGVPVDEPFFFEEKKFAGRVVSREVPVKHRTLEVWVEARSAPGGVVYFFDNLRVSTVGQPVTREKLRDDDVYDKIDATVAADPESGIQRYSLLPGHRESETFKVVANGQEIAVEALWSGLSVDSNAEDYQVAVARFAFDSQDRDELDIRIDADERIDSYSVSPRNPAEYGFEAVAPIVRCSVEERVLSLKLEEPRHLIVKINDLEYLIFLIDPLEIDPPDPSLESVINFSSYLPEERDPWADVTRELQQAIKESANAGKVLYLPDGRYMCGQLSICSGSRVYLSSGALLQSIPEWNRDLWPAQAGANDTNRDSSFIFVGDPQCDDSGRSVSEVSDILLFGRGAIDGNGWLMRTENDSSLITANIKLFRSARAQGLEVRDLYFRDSARWSFHILNSSKVRFVNVKLVNCLVGFRGNWTNDHKFQSQLSGAIRFHIPVVTNTDAYDIDATTDARFEGGLVFTGDDAFTPKVTGYMSMHGPCRDVLIRGNLIWTEKVALKLGPEAQGNIENIRFIDNDIARADRFMSAAIDGHKDVRIAGIEVLDNRMESTGGNAYQRLFRLRLQRNGWIRDVMVDGLDLLSAPPSYSSINGLDHDHKIGPVVLRNIRLRGDYLDHSEIFGSNKKQPFSLVKFYSPESIDDPLRGTAPVP